MIQNRFHVEWGETLGVTPYVRRWMLQTPWFSLRVHHWLRSDDLRNPHDHAWWFLTAVLWGRYDDVSPSGVDRLRAGSIRFRQATHRHSVRLYPNGGGAWTFLITGPETRTWGFWVGDRFRKRNKYFFEWGHH